MVEVIGQNKDIQKQITCKNCGSILRYVKADVREYHGTDYSGSPDGREWIVCPTCNEDVTIKAW